jgi:DNA-binding response OmpR family regulator
MMPPSADMDAEAVEYGRETGVEIARRMKALKPQVPIIALTVVSDPEIRTKMREAGIAYIINKPSDLEPMVDALLRWGSESKVEQVGRR